MKKNHSMQFGVQLLYIQDNQAYGAYAQAIEQLGEQLHCRDPESGHGQPGDLSGCGESQRGAALRGRIQYTGALTQTPGCSVTLPATSPSFARSDRFHDWAVYAQDSFKVTPKFTFNYGVRYEYYGVQHNNNQNLDSNFYYGSGANLFQQIRNGQVYTAPNSPIGRLWNPQYGTVVAAHRICLGSVRGRSHLPAWGIRHQLRAQLRQRHLQCDSESAELRRHRADGFGHQSDPCDQFQRRPARGLLGKRAVAAHQPAQCG